MDLSGELFGEKDAEAMGRMWRDDPSLRHQIARQVGRKLMKSSEVLPLGNEQFLALISLASFADSDDECIYVYGVLKHNLTNKYPFPLITEHKGYDLASRCLVSLGFFYRNMEKRTRYYGTPEPEFYREVGQDTFKKLGRRDVSEHFTSWEGFFQEVFC